MKWSSDNSTVVSVDEKTGEITALKVGDATITATVDDGSGISASTIVHVTPLKVHAMQFAEPKITVSGIKTEKLTLTLNSPEVDNKAIKWTSSDNSIVTVEENTEASYPLEAIVSTHKVGTAIITAEAQDGSGISATCEVEVTQLQVSDIELITMSAIKTIPTLLEANVLPVRPIIKN